MNQNPYNQYPLKNNEKKNQNLSSQQASKRQNNQSNEDLGQNIISNQNKNKNPYYLQASQLRDHESIGFIRKLQQKLDQTKNKNQSLKQQKNKLQEQNILLKKKLQKLQGDSNEYCFGVGCIILIAILVFCGYIIHQNQNQIKFLKHIVFQEVIQHRILKIVQSKDKQEHTKHLLENLQLMNKIKYFQLNTSLNIMRILADYYLNDQKYEEYVNINKKAIQLLQSQNINQAEQKYIFYLDSIGQGYLLMKRYCQALLFLNRGLALRKKQNQKKQVATLQRAKNLQNIGQCYEGMQDFVAAWDYYSKSLTEMIKLRSSLYLQEYSTEVSTSLIKNVDKFITDPKAKLVTIQAFLHKQ